ncbi:hypothetical protein EXIGLDRAFT_759782 [Exidia glandulosa HHB12029]|uniref:Uncharacterized protein n=1 Tax=Exidia glandulosa HHB12029 TaxID=1314781 RepID=A0A165PTU7_EXIGL|nr:hypothetical protein EXIGLDRAFT_759782 [Exidia glandulosa HHB12029]
MSVASVNTWTSSVRPNLAEPECTSRLSLSRAFRILTRSLFCLPFASPCTDFGRTNGKGTWYCAACTTEALAHLFSFDPAGAEEHERSAAHRARVHALTTSWGLGDIPPDEAAWEIVQETPYRDVIQKEKLLDVYSDAKVRRRVREWMRGCVLAQGGTWESDDEETLETAVAVEEDDDSDESGVQEGDDSVTTHTTEELHETRPFKFFPTSHAPNQLILDDSDSSDTTDSDAAKEAALRSVVSDEPLPAHFNFEMKAVRISHRGTKLAMSKDALRWLIWPAQKSIERFSRLLHRRRDWRRAPRV